MMLTSLQLKRMASIQSTGTPPNANKRRRIIASSEPSDTQIDDFPRWSKGTVWIEFSLESTFQYQLHKAVPERNSTWFAAELEKTIVEPGHVRKSHLKDAIRYLFCLELVEGAEKPVLSRIVNNSCKKQRKHVAHLGLSRLTSRTL